MITMFKWYKDNKLCFANRIDLCPAWYCEAMNLMMNEYHEYEQFMVEKANQRH